jgi:hypothetical protein
MKARIFGILILVSVKNPTVIAMTVLWMVGVGRALVLDRQPGLAPGGYATSEVRG